MKYFSRIICFVFCLICCLLANNSNAQIDRFNAQQYISPSGDTLRYRILYPDNDPLRSTPLVIFLHGAGERGSDNQAQLKWGVMNFATDEMMALHPAVVIAPQCPSNQSWSNIERVNNSTEAHLKPEPSKPMQLLRELIQQLIKDQHIDTTRIYITGLSLGGFGTFDAVERYPDLFAAALPVCGGGDVSKIATAAHIPMWICAGSDDPTVNPNYSVEMLIALRKAGAHPGFSLYPETGHFSWLYAYTDKHVIEWLFRQRKN